MKNYATSRQCFQFVRVAFCLMLATVSFYAFGSKGTRLEIAPIPVSEKKVTAYQVTVNGKDLPLYSARDGHFEKEYHFGTFDFEGKIEIRIRSIKSLAKVKVLPAEKFGIQTQVVSDNELVLKADRPFRISIEPDQQNRPLLLFANEIEKDVPSPDDPNVVYIPAGVHEKGCVKLTTGQTLYLAPGSILLGGVDAVGDNITIRGRGIVAGDIYKRFKGPCPNLIRVQNGRNIVVRDIILRHAWSWTLVAFKCKDLLIDNVKICGSNMINDDAIDLVNTSQASIRNCFLRSQDDNIAIKGMLTSREVCENILVENCELWTDRANSVRIGYECEAEAMRNIVIRNIDILHYTKFQTLPSIYWAHTLFWLQPSNGLPISDCLFENIKIHSQGTDINLILGRAMCTGSSTFKCEPNSPAVSLKKYLKYKKSGSVKNCTFRNVSVVGDKGAFRGEMYFEGRNENETISNIKLENITYFGEKLSSEFPLLTIKNFANNITFE